MKPSTRSPVTTDQQAVSAKDDQMDPHAQGIFETDALLDPAAQSALHFELIQEMLAGNPYGPKENEHIVQRFARARALMKRGVPIGPPSPVQAASTRGPEDIGDMEGIAPPITIHDARRPRCFDALIKWVWRQELQPELSALLLEYGRNGYFEVDFINAAGSPEKVTLLECAVMAENHCAAAVFIELGADLSLVPSKYKTINGMGVCEGDFHGLISKRFRRGSPMVTAVSGALMRLEIKAAAAASSAAIPSTDEFRAPVAEIKGSNSVDSGSVRRRGL